MKFQLLALCFLYKNYLINISNNVKVCIHTSIDLPTSRHDWKWKTNFISKMYEYNFLFWK